MRRWPGTVILGVAQAVNAALILAGATMVFWVIDRASRVLPTYEHQLGGDELRGYGFLIMGGAGIALVAAIGMAATGRGRRWGAAVVVALWALLWWPLGFWLQ